MHRILPGLNVMDWGTSYIYRVQVQKFVFFAPAIITTHQGYKSVKSDVLSFRLDYVELEPVNIVKPRVSILLWCQMWCMRVYFHLLAAVMLVNG